MWHKGHTAWALILHKIGQMADPPKPPPSPPKTKKSKKGKKAKKEELEDHADEVTDGGIEESVNEEEVRDEL